MKAGDFGNIKYLKVPIEERVHSKFINRCDFYDVTLSESFAFTMEKFIKGDFDRDLNIQKYAGR